MATSKRHPRRHFLALAGTGVGGLLAGCSASAEPIRLEPHESREPPHQRLIFEDEGTRTFTASVQLRGDGSDADRLQCKLTTTQREGVELDRLQFELESPPSAQPHESARISLVASGTAHEGLQFYQKPDDHSTAVVAFPEVTFGGSVGLEIVVEPRADDRRIAVDVDAELSGEGDTEYVAEGRTVVDPSELARD